MKAHITNLGLENFRVFKDKTHFEFAPITILTGTNSSGKSSLINAMELFNQKLGQIEEDSFFSFLQIFSAKGDKIEKQTFDSFQLAPTEINRRFGGFSTFKNIERQNDNISLFKNTTLPFTGEAIQAKIVYQNKFNDQKRGNLCAIEITLDSTAQILFSLKIHNQAVLGYVNFSFFLDWIDSFLHNNKVSFVNRDISLHGQDEESDNYFQELEDDEIRKRLQAFFKSNQPFFSISNALFSIGGPTDFDEDASHAYNEEYKKATNLFIKNLELNDFSKEIESAGSLDKFKFNQQRIFLNDKYFIIRDEAEQLEPRDLLKFSQSICLPLSSNRYKDISSSMNYYDKIVDKYTITSKRSKEYSEQVKFIFNDFIWGRFNKVLSEFSPKVLHFIPAAKIQTERIYLDFDKNRSIVNLRTLSDIIVKLSKYENDILVSYFRSSLKILGDDFDFQIESGSDASSSLVFITTKGKKILLADAGFGISQYLNLLAQVIISSYSVITQYRSSNAEHVMDLDEYVNEFKPEVTILLIEEPEAHLHPALQSKLGDVFVNAARTFNTQFIIETHSEYLIRKLQYLTAKGEIKPEDTAIYYFYPPDDVPPGEDQVKRIDIQEDGSLSDDFGTGFFDEADKIAMSIWNMNKSQKN